MVLVAEGPEGVDTIEEEHEGPATMGVSISNREKIWSQKKYSNVSGLPSYSEDSRNSQIKKKEAPRVAYIAWIWRSGEIRPKDIACDVRSVDVRSKMMRV